MNGTPAHLLHRFGIAVAALLVAVPASGQQPHAWTSGHSEVHTLTSASGTNYELVVALPRTYATSRSQYPVLLILDGDVLFPLAAQIAATLSHEQIRELIVVGLGAKPITREIRVRDFTPTVAPEPGTIEDGPEDGPRTGGGAEAFLTFIRERVIPFIEANYRTDPIGRGIFGHSYGGLFAVYTLLHAPDTFSRYIVSSPSLWWDQEITLRYEERYARAHRDLRAKVFVGNGELEESSADARSTTFAQLTNAAELIARLSGRGYPSFRLSSHVFAGEAHMTVIPFTLSRGMRALYAR